MERLEGDLAEHGIRGLVHRLFVERAEGVLEVVAGEHQRRLFFRGGELYLPASSPLAPRLVERLRQGGWGGEGKELIARVAAVVDGWRDGAYLFREGAEEVPDDAVGPLPTVELVMALSVLGRSEAELLEQLGGLAAEMASQPPNEELVRHLHLAVGEVMILDLLARPQIVESVLRGTPGDRRQVLETLCRLQAVGLLSSRQRPAQQESLVNPQVLQRFSERVVRSLATEPVDLDPAEHRAKLGELLGRLGEVGHYELLEVEAEAAVEKVHTAYDRLARLVHPLHATHLELKGREEGMRLLFERATEAYLVLTDPDRRRRYDREVAVQRPTSEAGEDLARRSKEEARRYYLQAREMIEEGEYHYALELLRRAVQADPRAEHYALLAEVQRRNPKWLRQAVDSYRKAIQHAPGHSPYRLSLGELFERLEDYDRARAAYRSALMRSPDDAAAQAALDRLERKLGGKRPGFLGRLFGQE